MDIMKVMNYLVTLMVPKLVLQTREKQWESWLVVSLSAITLEMIDSGYWMEHGKDVKVQGLPKGKDSAQNVPENVKGWQKVQNVSVTLKDFWWVESPSAQMKEKYSGANK